MLFSKLCNRCEIPKFSAMRRGRLSKRYFDMIDSLVLAMYLPTSVQIIRP